jgi:hypothetical protein
MVNKMESIQITLACKRGNKTRSYINRSNVHWKIKGRWSWGTSFCGGTNSVEGRKGRKCCCVGRTSICKSVVESTTSHKGVDNGRSTMKGDGDGAVWNESGSK